MHIEKPKSIGLEFADRGCEYISVVRLYRPRPGGDLCLGRAVGNVAHPGKRFGIFAAVVRRFGSGPASILPLGLGRQAIAVCTWHWAPTPLSIGRVTRVALLARAEPI